MSLSARAEVTESASDWISSNAFAYAEIVQPARLIDQITGPRVAKLLNAVPGLNDALDRKEVRELYTVADLLANSLDLSTEDAARSLTKGGIVLAVEGETSPQRIILDRHPRRPRPAQKGPRPPPGTRPSRRQQQGQA